MEAAEPSVSPWALQLAVRVEKLDPPTTAQVCGVAALATIELLDDQRSRPEGEWHEAVSAWNGDKSRKIVRRGRASGWRRAQEPDGVTAERDGVEVRAFVPSRRDEAPEGITQLQIQSSPLDEIEPIDVLPDATGLIIAVTPLVEMSWGKQAAQCAHAGQWAWMRSDGEVVSRWDAAGRPITVVHPNRQLWAELVESAPVQIHDGGYTEISAGTKTALAWWAEPF